MYLICSTHQHIKVIGDIVDSDPLTEYEADPDLAYAGADPETGDLLPE
jgi:hypothetical protein